MRELMDFTLFHLLFLKFILFVFMFQFLFKKLLKTFENYWNFIIGIGPWLKNKKNQDFVFDGVDYIILFYGFVAGFILFYVVTQAHFNFYNNGINFPKV